MSEIDTSENTGWFPVIGRALAFLCLSRAAEREPGKFEGVLAKVEFLEGLGLSEKNAAEVAGSSIQSVRELRRQRKKVKNGKGKDKKGRR